MSGSSRVSKGLEGSSSGLGGAAIVSTTSKTRVLRSKSQGKKDLFQQCLWHIRINWWVWMLLCVRSKGIYVLRRIRTINYFDYI